MLECSKLHHTPFLAFIESDDAIQVRIVYSAKELLTLPDDTPIMGQWKGEWIVTTFSLLPGNIVNSSKHSKSQYTLQEQEMAHQEQLEILKQGVANLFT